MPVPPDDLPRSPSGRLPRWVVDEATGVRADTGWRTYAPSPPPPRPPRRRATGVVGVVALVALTGAWWLTGGTSAVPGDLAAALAGGPGLVPAGSAPADAPSAVPAPSADVVALADAAHLSEEGRELFYSARPEVLDESAFIGRCGGTTPTDGARTGGAVGCYQPMTHTIVVYRPADPRLQGSVVETAAHETLHAAWLRLTAAEQAELTALLEAEVAAIPADDAIHRQIEGSVGAHPESRPTELFAYVGTQVWRDGGLAPGLEAVLGRFVADRAALVAVHTATEGALAAMSADIQAAVDAVAAQELATAQDRLRYEGDVASSGFYRQAYDARTAELAAMPVERRQGLLLSWRWWDGTELPMAPADQTLAAAADLLARDQVDLAAREAALRTAEDAARAERARIAALVADLDALHDQLVPGPPAG